MMRGFVERLAVAIGGALVCTLVFASAAIACPNDRYRVGASSGLPECRAYEMVSPREKAGHDIVVDTGRSQVAQGEDASLPAAAMFSALGGFSGPVGSGVAFDYLAQRTLAPDSQGWTTHPITPLQAPLPSTGVIGTQAPGYVGDADVDLTRMLFRADMPLSPAPNVNRVDNLYLRSDLRMPGSGAYQLLTDAVAPVTPFGLNPSVRTLPNVAGTSADLGHVLFESIYALTADAPPAPAPKLYESVDGAVRLVGILPADEGGGPAPRSIAGQDSGSATGGHRYTPHVISTDGSRAIFTVATSNFSVDGDLYMRDDHGTLDPSDDATIKLNASENAGSTPAPADYWDAAADDSRMFFTSTEPLTADAAGGFENLYMYDASKPDSDPHNLTVLSIDNNPVDGQGQVFGTLGVSNDGKTVYFAETGQIVPGGPELDDNTGIYVWHEGDGVRYVGELPNAQDLIDDTGGRTHPTVQPPFQLGARVTPDGRFLLFSARQSPSPGGPNDATCDGSGACAELYLYDAQTGDAPVCVSCRPDGAPSTTPAFFSARVGAGGSSIEATHLNAPLTTDGSKVFFTTGEPLVPQDLNGRNDVYEYDVATGDLHLLSSGRSSSDSYFVDATPDGHDVYIASREQLSPWDVDGNTDLYDVRVDGGVPGPPEPAGECTGDACQGVLTGAPDPFVAGSSLLTQAPASTPTRHGLTVVSRVWRHGTLIVKVKAFEAGTIGVAGSLVTTTRHVVSRAGTYTLHVRLRASVRRHLKLGHRLKLNVRVRFTPKHGKSSVHRLSVTVKA